MGECNKEEIEGITHEGEQRERNTRCEGRVRTYEERKRTLRGKGVRRGSSKKKEKRKTPEDLLPRGEDRERGGGGGEGKGGGGGW